MDYLGVTPLKKGGGLSAVAFFSLKKAKKELQQSLYPLRKLTSGVISASNNSEK